MKHLNLNQFMQDVHQNAISHGWWDNPRSEGTIRALIHDELSEALEEYRDSKPMIYRVRMENQEIKPEGIAVELMDFVIRILDYMGKNDHVFAGNMCTAETLASWSVDDFQMDDDGSVLDLELPDFVDILHDEISLSSVMQSETYLATAAGLAIAWVEKQGLDPVELLVEKHEYNRTRPYKHGGKVC